MNQEKVQTSWDEANQIATFKLIGEFDDEHATQAVQKYLDMLDNLEQKDILLRRVIYDITEAGEATAEAKRIFAGFAKSIGDKYKTVRVAYIGGNKLAMMASVFIHKISGVGEVKFFKTEKEAKEWLKAV